MGLALFWNSLLFLLEGKLKFERAKTWDCFSQHGFDRHTDTGHRSAKNCIDKPKHGYKVHKGSCACNYRLLDLIALFNKTEAHREKKTGWRQFWNWQTGNTLVRLWRRWRQDDDIEQKGSKISEQRESIEENGDFITRKERPEAQLASQSERCREV